MHPGHRVDPYQAVLCERLHGLRRVLLARPATELTILEVVNAVEPIRRITTCPLGIASHGVNLCPLHKRMDDALAMVEKAFRESTLAEVLAEPTTSVPLCAFPGVPLGIRTREAGTG